MTTFSSLTVQNMHHIHSRDFRLYNPDLDPVRTPSFGTHFLPLQHKNKTEQHVTMFINIPSPRFDRDGRQYPDDNVWPHAHGEKLLKLDA